MQNIFYNLKTRVANHLYFLLSEIEIFQHFSPQKPHVPQKTKFFLKSETLDCISILRKALSLLIEIIKTKKKFSEEPFTTLL